MNDKINNVIFFTGEAATGKTWISDQLVRYLKSNNHVNPFIIHLGDKVRADQKAGIEPANSFINKTENKILLSKDEIEQLMSHYLSEVDKNANCIIIEGFPRTKDDMDLLSEELRNKYYPNAKLSLVALSFKDVEGSVHGMKERQKIPEKYREELDSEQARQKKQENYTNEIKPAIEYFKEKYENSENMSLIELELKNKDFFINFKEGDKLNASVFEELVRKLPYDFDLEKYEKENQELSKQTKIKFR